MIDETSWGPFFEEEAAKIINDHRAPGLAAILLRRGSHNRLERAWGFASLDPERALELDTPIRAGSISKVVTAIAVQQLVESGELDLGIQLSDVLGRQLPYGYGAATIGDLLTHRAGIGERFVRQSTRQAAKIKNLSGFLGESLPPPVAAVGASLTYSNFGVSLAGLAVEVVKGKPFADYARDAIFRPLGMRRATFIPDLKTETELSEGYNWVFGSCRKLPLRHWKVYPASSLVASPRDLGLLMKVFLEDKSLILDQSSSLLDEKTSLLSGLPGMGMAFWLDEMRGQKVIWHTGHMPGHRTGFYLFPDAGFGIILYYNIETNLLRGFLERVVSFAFCDPPHTRGTESGSRQRLNQYCGYYRHSWYPHHHLGKCAALLGKEGEEVQVKERNGRILIEQESYAHLGGDVFLEKKLGKRIGFLRDSYNRVTGLYLGGRDRFERISIATKGRTQMGLAATCALLFFMCSFTILLNMFKGVPILATEIGWGLSLTCLLNLGFGVGIIMMTAQGGSRLIQDAPFPLGFLLAFPLFGFIVWSMTILRVFYSWDTGWIHSAWGYSTVIVACVSEVAFIWFLFYWRLLGWRY
ncbi:MAG: D-alanyl-D-alanine carboxypeptidase [Candidatus Moanabacter tarae]|uniref:D-alanyl-D-alanine carboxypeptidase n=1 Tax=Candidatus Moanibacter tarae TaxID=2200854 RepID=A0A2Z4AMZ2_9BACT|nr:MAG: D-alanyl-D-alanine carboxypeptidase [Candidatus Moanabacter tarae]